MLAVYDMIDGVLVKQTGVAAITDQTVWLDLCRPTKDEDLLVEKSLSVAVPTMDEMSEIEASSRLYQESGAHYMTAVVLHQKVIAEPTSAARRNKPVDTIDVPMSTPVTFILANHRLVTVRYEEPRALEIFLSRNQKGDVRCHSGAAVLIGLLEAIIDREADRVERVQAEVDKLGHGIFEMKGGQASRNRRFDIAMRQIGREGELTSRSRESLQSLGRLLTYMALIMGERGDDKALRARVRTASRDVESLNDQVHYLAGKVGFLLDATLGLINIEQNSIIKFFTVVSVALMPPTLIASIYGMNFKNMPELDWIWGYPLAVVLMLISGVIPFIWFKRKGWL